MAVNLHEVKNLCPLYPLGKEPVILTGWKAALSPVRDWTLWRREYLIPVGKRTQV
jgi:hypothetical protein